MYQIDNYVNFWKSVDLTNIDKMHKNDSDILSNRKKILKSFDEYINEYYFKENSEIHSGLIPQPYIGDLINSRIVFLLLNPGFSPSDYFDEQNQEYRNALINCLYQNKNNENYFYPLDPKFCWTDSGKWWHKKLKPVIEQIMDVEKCSYLTASKSLSSKICAIELFPYHSKTFSISDNELLKLDSVKFSKALANEFSKDSDKLIICMRKVKFWDIRTDNCVNFTNFGARSAYIKKECVDKIMSRYQHRTKVST